MRNQKLVLFLLRISITSVFWYAAIASTLEPENWIGFLPQTLRNMFPANQLLVVFSVYEALLGVWVVSGWKTFYAACLAILTLTGIIITNFGAVDIVFRDLAIIGAALALAAAYYPIKE
ncbi:MAG: DoxX family membrane protein [Patescibacteria group bacterium]|nr:DoxX family membrane protein [Patescibacteria group bacterium]MDE2590890.1 DoxX family membrane protein [Patescibacteria group bacterium]